MKYTNIIIEGSEYEHLTHLMSISPFLQEGAHQLVPSEKSNLKNNRITVLAPISQALFGYAEGAELEWQFPVGIKKIRILEVINYQSRIKAAVVC